MGITTLCKDRLRKGSREGRVACAVMLTLGRMRQEGLEFKASIYYLVRSCLKKNRASEMA